MIFLFLKLNNMAVDYDIMRDEGRVMMCSHDVFRGVNVLALGRAVGGRGVKIILVYSAFRCVHIY